jgi:hypothetical protein
MVRRSTHEDGALIAYCWRSGRIDFGYVMPEGCFKIASSHDEQRLRDIVSANARHSYPPEDYLLVPGIPEAKDSEEALLAFGIFWERMREKVHG